jgi:hypothetical protein
MPRNHFLLPSLALSAVLAVALAAPPAGAQAPRPGQLAPGPGGQQQPPRGPAQGAPQAPPPGGPQAQQSAPPKPYKLIPGTLPQPAGLVAPNFFWMGEKGDKANKKKTGIDNLAAAIELDDKEGGGWSALAGAADEATLEAIPDRKGIMCGPAGPTFDEAAAEAVAKDSGTDPSDWAYPSKAGLEVRAAAQPNAPVIDKLGVNLVRVMPEQPPAGGAPPPESPFIRIVTPAGKVGFVLEEAMSALDQDQMCYVKDATGWKIAGYAGGN